MDLFTILGWFLVLLMGLIGISLVFYSRWYYGSLESLGIPVIKPFLFFGSNYMEPYVNMQELDIQRVKKYGSIYGLYDGRNPQIYISDPKLIRQITTVDFEHFRNHGWQFGTDGSSIMENLLDILVDERWKIVRSALTPIFTGGKIKMLTNIVQEIGEDYANFLLEDCSAKGGRLEKIRFREFVAPMVIEILAKCFCGIVIPDAKSEQNEFIRNMKLALLHDPPIDAGWKVVLTKIFPILMKLNPIQMDEGGMNFFVSALKSILASRERSTEVRIDATATLVEMIKKTRNDPTYIRLNIHENVVIAQAWEFFLGGYFGIRDSFDSFMFEMASNPTIQEDLYQEMVSQLTSNSSTVTLETISNDLPLLTACLLESARMHQSFIRPERICNTDWSFEGIRIPAGTQVIFPMAGIHFNEINYPNPTSFNPERFRGEAKKARDPYTFMVFGHGPRSCIGQRFVMEMLKVLVVLFLTKFKIVKRPDTICEPNVGGNFGLFFKPLYIDLEKRMGARLRIS